MSDYPVWRLDLLGTALSVPVLAGAIAAKKPELTRRVVTLVALAQVVCLALALPAPAFALFIALALGVGCWEVCRVYGRDRLLAALTAAALAAYAATLWVPALAVPVGALAAAASIAVLANPGGIDARFPFGAAALVLLVACGFASLVVLAGSKTGAAFGVLFLSQMHDSGALLGGRALGGPRPFPALSPNKTTAGYVCGALATAVGLLLLPIAIPGMARLGAVPFAVAVGFVSIGAGGGDLVFSAWKRALGIKDWSGVLGAHGGVLDRFGNICIMAAILHGTGALGWNLLYNA